MERAILVWSDWNIWDPSFEGSPLWPDRPKLNVPFHLTKLFPQYRSFVSYTYKNNNQMRGGLGWVCATRMYCSIIVDVKFPKFQARFFVEWKVA